MRLALFSDVHGNSIALDAVLADIAAQGGVDGYWILGDLAAIGYDPVGAIERLVALPNVRFTRGNTDRYVVAGGRSGRDAATVRANPDLLETVIQIAVERSHHPAAPFIVQYFQGRHRPFWE